MLCCCAARSRVPPRNVENAARAWTRHLVLIVVQAPWNRAEQHMAPAATGPQGSVRSRRAPPKPPGHAPHFPAGSSNQ